jgi:hypothetical protein
MQISTERLARTVEDTLNPGVGQHAPNPLGDVAAVAGPGVAAGVDHQHREVGMVLLGQGVQEPVEPLGGCVVGDDDRHDRRRVGR